MIATTDNLACSSFVYGHARIDEGQNIHWSWLLQAALNKVLYEDITIVLSSYSGYHMYGGEFARLVLRNSLKHKTRHLWKIETITDLIRRSVRHLGLWQSTLPCKDMIKSWKKIATMVTHNRRQRWSGPCHPTTTRGEIAHRFCGLIYSLPARSAARTTIATTFGLSRMPWLVRVQLTEGSLSGQTCASKTVRSRPSLMRCLPVWRQRQHSACSHAIIPPPTTLPTLNDLFPSLG